MPFVRLPDRIAARMTAFSLIGVTNGIVGIGVIVIAGLAGVRPALANVPGYGAGLVVSFALNSRVTFQSRQTDRRTVGRFLAAFAFAFFVNLAAVHITARLYPSHGLLASLAGTPAYVALFYLLCEFWVFRRHPENAESSKTRIP